MMRWLFVLAVVSAWGQVGAQDNAGGYVPDYRLDFPPFMTNLPKQYKDIKYPKDALERGVEGEVLLRFYVNERGDTDSVGITRSADAELAKACLKAARALSFTPGTAQNLPVAYYTDAGFTFYAGVVGVRPPMPFNPAEYDPSLFPPDSSPAPDPTFFFVHPDSVARAVNLSHIQRLVGYPIEAHEKRISGRVTYRILVDKYGRYEAHQVAGPANPLLRRATERYLPYIRFKAAIHKGQPVKSWLLLPFDFQLSNSNQPGG